MDGDTTSILGCTNTSYGSQAVIIGINCASTLEMRSDKPSPNSTSREQLL